MESNLLYEMYVLVERPKTPAFVKHCVAKVAPKYGGDVSKAFAICVAQMQKTGRLEPGTIEPTDLGKTVAKAKKKQPEHGKKVASYEKLLKRAKKRRKRS